MLRQKVALGRSEAVAAIQAEDVVREYRFVSGDRRFRLDRFGWNLPDGLESLMDVAAQSRT
jgi:hypothetical protein